MKKRLREIAHIQTGLFAKPSGRGELVYLQAKHFDEHGQLDTVLYPDLSADVIAERHLLQNGDVLFAAKGTKNFATVFENHNEPSVASTSFFVIRLNEKKILPQYLAWVLNHPKIQAFLKNQAIGTSIPSISKQVLENLEIVIPTTEKQNLIVQITALRNKEKDLKQKIENLREKEIQSCLLKAIAK